MALDETLEAMAGEYVLGTLAASRADRSADPPGAERRFCRGRRSVDPTPARCCSPSARCTAGAFARAHPGQRRPRLRFVRQCRRSWRRVAFWRGVSLAASAIAAALALFILFKPDAAGGTRQLCRRAATGRAGACLRRLDRHQGRHDQREAARRPGGSRQDLRIVGGRRRARSAAVAWRHRCEPEDSGRPARQGRSGDARTRRSSPSASSRKAARPPVRPPGLCSIPASCSPPSEMQPG